MASQALSRETGCARGPAQELQHGYGHHLPRLQEAPHRCQDCGGECGNSFKFRVPGLKSSSHKALPLPAIMMRCPQRKMAVCRDTNLRFLATLGMTNSLIAHGSELLHGFQTGQ